jgi:murein L,D-transpeptidase YcbB/YkuD
MVGQDWSDPGAVVREAKRIGFTATVTYPTNPREGHHINFRKEPRLVPQYKPLRLGSTGRRVKGLTRRLTFIKDRHGHHYLKHAYNTYTKEVESAVRRFQIDHHQRADGVYGLQTARQLNASVRWRKRKNREEKKR